MATWREITENPDFIELPIKEKVKTKTEFFDNVISKSDKFTTLPTEQQAKIKTKFYLNDEDLFPSPKATLPRIVDDAYAEYVRRSPLAVLDKPVEEFAKFVEPEIKAGESNLKLYGVDLPRQVGAEVIRGFKPSAVAPYYVGTKLAGMAVKPLVKPVAKFVVSKTPEAVKTVLRPVGKFLTKNLTVGKGKPVAYQQMAREAELERLAGGREASNVAKTLTTKPTGEALSMEEQRYVGRIFRKEIDLGGRKSFVTQTPEQSAKMAKNIEVEVAFNPEVQSLQKELELVNKSLKNKELLAEGLVGKEFRTGTGFIEKATGISKEAKINLSGKPSAKRFDIGLVSKPVSPIEGQIPSEFLEEGEQIVRGLKQISKSSTTNKFQNLPRQTLLKQRKILSNKIQQKLQDIELGVKSNYYLFDREFSEQIRVHPKYQELSSIADEGRLVMDKWSNELAKSGIPKDQARATIEENIGSYMARMYKSKLKPETGSFNLFKNTRLRLNGLKHRKDLSSEVLNMMGEIKEPALPTAIRVKEISSSVANNKLFNQVAKNPEWVADTNIGGKLVKMPDSANVGVLKGKYVIPEIAEDINSVISAGKQSQGIYLKALSAWKYGKVVLNPAAQARNALSNTILLDLSGTNHLRQAQLFPKAFNEYLSQGKIYQQALKDGAIGGEFVGTETMQKLKDVYISSQEGNLQRWMRIANTPFKKAGELYQGMEQMAKMVKYMDVLEKTGNGKLAAQEAQKWLFNYNEVPQFIDIVRKSPIGAPFITFTYKTIPRLAETLVNRPMALYKYKVLADAINETSRKYLGMTPVDYARQKKLLPLWVLKDIGGMPTNLLLPWRDKYGRTQWLNLEYILPVGQVPEMAERGLGGFVSSPAFNIVADIIKNTDFKNTQIVPPEATKLEAATAIASYIYRQLVPSLAPGGYSSEKIRAGFANEPERFNPERTREAIPALLDTLVGVKINSLDVDEAEQFKLWNKKKRIDALNQEFYRVYNNPLLKEEFRDKRIEDIFKKKEKVLEE